MNTSSLKISTTLKDAWQKVEGSKSALWGTNITILIVSLLILFALLLVMSSLFVHTGQPSASFYLSKIFQYFAVGSPFIISILIAPLLAGLFIVAIKRARNETVSFNQGYSYFHKWGATAIALFIITLLVQIIQYITAIIQFRYYAFVLHPLIIVSFSMMLTTMIYTFLLYSLPLIIEKNLSGIKALSFSCQMVKHAWLKIYLLFLICTILIIATTIPTLIGLYIDHALAILIGVAASVFVAIWVFPYTLMILGEAYIKLQD